MHFKSACHITAAAEKDKSCEFPDTPQEAPNMGARCSATEQLT